MRIGKLYISIQWDPVAKAKKRMKEYLISEKGKKDIARFADESLAKMDWTGLARALEQLTGWKDWDNSPPKPPLIQ